MERVVRLVMFAVLTCASLCGCARVWEDDAMSNVATELKRAREKIKGLEEELKQAKEDRDLAMRSRSEAQKIADDTRMRNAELMMQVRKLNDDMARITESKRTLEENLSRVSKEIKALRTAFETAGIRLKTE